MKINQLLFFGAALCSLFSNTNPLSAQGTAFSYQGHLLEGGQAANGSYDIEFTLFDAITNGNCVAGPLTNSATSASNGLFSVTLDFGDGVFTGSNYWLEVAVQTNGGSGFTTMTPRQPMTATPYALFAPNAGTALTAATANSVAAGATISGDGSGLTNLNASQFNSGAIPLAQLPPVVVTNGQSALTLSGTFSGDGSGLTAIPAANLTGSIPAAALPDAVVTNGATNVVLGGTFAGDGSALTNLNASQFNSGAIPLAQLPPVVMTNGQSAVTLNGTFSGDGSSLTNLNASQITGGTVPISAIPPVFLTNNETAAVNLDNGAITTSGTGTLGFGLGSFVFPPWGVAPIEIYAPGGLGGMTIIGDPRYGPIGHYRIQAGQNGSMAMNGFLLMDADESVQYIPASQNAMFAAGQDSTHGMVWYMWDGYQPIFEAFTSTAPNDYPVCTAYPDGLKTLNIQGNGFTTITRTPVYGLGSMFTLVEADSFYTNQWGFDAISNQLVIGQTVGSSNTAVHTNVSLILSTNGVEISGGILTLDAGLNMQGANGNLSVGGTISGDGSGLTNLNASQFSSGAIPLAQLPAAVVTNGQAAVTLGGTFSGDGSGLTAIPAASLTGAIPAASLPDAVVTNGTTNVVLGGSFAGDGSGLTNLNASQFNSGAIPLAQLPAAVVTNGQAAVTLGGTFSGDGSGLTVIPAASLSGVIPTASLPAAVVTNGATNLVLGGSFAGDGSGLTNLNASQFNSGAIPLAQLPAAVVTNGQAAVTLGGTFSGDGSGLANLNAANLTSGPIPYGALPALGTNLAITVTNVTGTAGDSGLVLLTNGAALILSNYVNTSGGSGGSALSFNPSQIDTNSSGQVEIKSGAGVNNLQIMNSTNLGSQYVAATNFSGPYVTRVPISCYAAKVASAVVYTNLQPSQTIGTWTVNFTIANMPVSFAPGMHTNACFGESRTVIYYATNTSSAPSGYAITGNNGSSLCTSAAISSPAPGFTITVGSLNNTYTNHITGWVDIAYAPSN